MTLRRKLAIHIAALILILILIGIGGLWSLDALRSDYSATFTGYQRLRDLYEVGAHVETARTLLNISPPQTQSARDELHRALGTFDLDFPANDATLDADQRDLQQAVRDALTKVIASETSSAGLDESSLNDCLKPLAGLDVLNRQMIEAAQSRADHKRELTMIWMAGLIGAASLLAIFIGVAQYRAVMKPLNQLNKTVRQFALGELQERVPVNGTVEFAQLAGEFNRMAGELDGLYRDLREKVEAKSRQLVQNERLASVGFLAAGVAHEINNPLGIITAHAELSLESAGHVNGSANDPEIRKSLVVICEEAFRCKSIVEKLLSLARGQGESPMPVSLGQIASQAVATISSMPEYSRRKLLFASRVKPDEDVILARPGEVRQVLLNLIFNALQATPDDGEVVVGVNRGEKAVELLVSDTGRGMTREIMEHIFEPFYTNPRGKIPGSDTRRGTGLGLSITHAIVQRHGGAIEAESEGPGMGSTFTVTFPPAKPPAAQGTDA
jgi:signal transduction histidine kinase